jgi:hypothetical protein
MRITAGFSSGSGSGCSGEHSLVSLKVSCALISDFFNLLAAYCDRVGMDNPTIEVRFERLGIEAEAPVGNKSVPTFLSFFSNSIMVRKHYPVASVMLQLHG